MTTPVEVSDSVVYTTFAPAYSPSARSRSAGSTLLPHPASRCSNSAPNAALSSTQRSPNLPHEATSAGPAAARFATADSIPPDPEEAKHSTSLSVCTTFFRPARQRAYTSMKAGARW